LVKIHARLFAILAGWMGVDDSSSQAFWGVLLLFRKSQIPQSPQKQNICKTRKFKPSLQKHTIGKNQKAGQN
jgi:hypothetical protein